MKKYLLIVFGAFILSNSYAQVGVNTDNPNTTLDVSAKRTADGSIEDPSHVLGIQAPRITRLELTNSTATYGANQTGAIIYITNVAGGNTNDSRVNVTSVGYYYFDGTLWQKMEGETINIYNTNSTVTSNRTATIPSGRWLNFAGAGYVGIGGVDPMAKLNVNGFIQFATDSHYGVGKLINDNTGEKYGLTQSSYFPSTGDAYSPGTRVYTSGSPGVPGHISFGIYTGPTTYTEWARFSHKLGNLGINTINGSSTNNPTEKLDVNGITRVRVLPQNGAANSIYTMPDGSASINKDQTFNATRTVVADANGVLGYVNSLPAGFALTNVSLPTNAFRHQAGNSNSAKYTGIYFDIPPGQHKIDINLALTLSTIDEYTVGSNLVRFRLAESTADVATNKIHPDAVQPKFASQAFAFSQNQGFVNGSLGVNNQTSGVKRYYLHIDNASSNGVYQEVTIDTQKEESSILFYQVQPN